MKKLAFFILLSLVTLGVSAQSNLKWNVNAGIGMSNWYGDNGCFSFRKKQPFFLDETWFIK